MRLTILLPRAACAPAAFAQARQCAVRARERSAAEAGFARVLLVYVVTPKAKKKTHGAGGAFSYEKKATEHGTQPACVSQGASRCASRPVSLRLVRLARQFAAEEEACGPNGTFFLFL
jgi:hypothetical protein